MHQAPGTVSLWLTHNLHTLTLCIGAACTLGLYSVLYKENRLYRLFEHLFLGLATGFMVANIWTDVVRPKWWVPMWDQGQWWLIFALVAGLFYYFIYSPKHSWLARLIIGFFMGVASGQAFQVFVNDTWPQIHGSFKPLIPHGAIKAQAHEAAIPALTFTDALNNLIFVVVLACVMSYFFFSIEQKNPVVRGSARLGRWLMMFAFGAIFGATVMARMALLIDRMYFLFFEFGGLLGAQPGKPSVLMFAILLGLIALLLVLTARSKREDGSEAE
jgi:hypothetical protein